ncbi:MAG TPA: MerR family transcriptional regulator [Acidimicrobiales bacterium]|nr:MerR family transcriptional regulator [Acidimicrobiales bacterium]
MASREPRGWYLAGEVGRLAGTSGETIGQWARRGYISSSQSIGVPRVYSFQDVAEAMVVHELLERGLTHREIRRAIRNLRQRFGDWPLLTAPIATTDMRRVFGADAKEFLLLLEKGGTQVDAVQGASTQFMLNLSLGLRAVTKLLRRGGWAVKDLPHVQSIEVDPDRLSGRPTIRSRRIPADKVAILAQTSDGRQSLESDYRLSAKQIEDAVRWYGAVSAYEKAA